MACNTWSVSVPAVRSPEMCGSATSWLLSRVAAMALQDGPAIRVGRVFTSNFFYHARQDLLDLLKRSP